MPRKTYRTRSKAVTIRMTDKEYAILQEKVKESGLSQQAFILSSIQGASIISSDEILVLKEISKTFSSLVSQLRGLANNVNQMAHIANGQGYLPPLSELQKINMVISKFRKEGDDLWLLIRSSINQQKHTVQ